MNLLHIIHINHIPIDELNESHYVRNMMFTRFSRMSSEQAATTYHRQHSQATAKSSQMQVIVFS